jgi:hypothetical protein
MIQDSDIRLLSSLFKNYKAEWLGEELFEHFQEPIYHHELTSNQPCLLYGGRGSGKTTALMGLSYEGQEKLNKGATFSPRNLPFYGIFHRVNGIHAAEFEGDEVSPKDWERLFSHYWNLVMAENFARFFIWLENTDIEFLTLAEDEVSHICHSLGIEADGIISTSLLVKAISGELNDLSQRLGNIADSGCGKTSSLGAPIKLMTEALRRRPSIGSKGIFYIVDEYENLLEYQQKAVNTLIKYSAPDYTFKVGVRKYGMHTFSTLSPVDYLEHPADFVQLTIEDKFTQLEFERFATSVCQSRLNKVEGLNGIRLELLFDSISANDEALKLSGDNGVVQKAYERIKSEVADVFPIKIDALDAFLLCEYEAHYRIKLTDLLKRVRTEPRRWRVHLDNYRHQGLFSIRKGKAGIRKYYAGVSTFARMSESNIRAFMELVEQSIIHWAGDESQKQSISVEHQTKAAIYVGERRLRILEGRTLMGNSISRLLVSIGRLFGFLTTRVYGASPEINQFEVIGAIHPQRNTGRPYTVPGLLNDAVMNLALVERTSTKPLTISDSRSREYQIHPIFSAFFCISYRIKRKIKIKEEDVFELIDDPPKAIPRLSKGICTDEQLAENAQLDLWE